MADYLYTALQLISIGIGLGISGPCLFSCAPVVLAFSAGSGASWLQSACDASVFCLGRLAAYVSLGTAAGFSSALLYRFAGAPCTGQIRFFSALLSVFLGILVLTGKAGCRAGHSRAGRTGLFLSGVSLGIAPCAPLFALMLEILLISKNPFQGALYAFYFGIGTAIAGIAVFSAVAVIALRMPIAAFNSAKVFPLVRLSAGLFLICSGALSLAVF